MIKKQRYNKRIWEIYYTFVVQELFESIVTANRRNSHDSQIVTSFFSKQFQEKRFYKYVARTVGKVCSRQEIELIRFYIFPGNYDRGIFIFDLLLSSKNHEAFQKQHFPGQPLISFQGGLVKQEKSVIIGPYTRLPDSNNIQ